MESITNTNNHTAHIIHINESNIAPMIQHSLTQLVVFYFWSPQNLHCHELEETLDKLAHEYAGQFALAKVDCDQLPNIAAQFGVRTAPTVIFVQEARPVHGFEGIQTDETIRKMFSQFLTQQKKSLLEQANERLAEGKNQEALSLLKEAHQTEPKEIDITLLLAQVYISLNHLEDAQNILDTLPLEEQDQRYNDLLAILESQKQAANSPEIQQLQQALEIQPENAELAVQLATKLHEVGRNEEALELLFSFLKKDLSTADGAVKKMLMDIISTLETGDTLASKYRRHVYSLLY
ncbi:co-chaperone YbbN [Xenorhabdus bovienii]|uniref:co-chaperone YbbN n=1 Tax=Xenorhabdus bovienii TaxID=40576 RepID=UPI0004D86637|nr:co-chaperone YbbN [Xenorhabdus bovienii]CDG87272.1 putative thioredoxin protein with protein prenylyltransferase [Xenorhabdus bovienii str. feltiae France]CDG91175.1 putative thioredoxin protein with protein prenylyltransferase [Xenorhabdus bovienii str. feltiae Florida]